MASILRRVFQRSTGVFNSRLISSKSGSEEAPLLMLLPSFEGNDMYYKFYSPTEQKVFSIKKSLQSEAPAPDDDAEFVGSSHGWLVLLNRRNNDLFLSNPRSRRHIKLPPIQANLPDPEINMRNGRAIVGKVILSSSPDEQGCRAMMTFGPGNRLAFCMPGRSWRWTPLGKFFQRNRIQLNGGVKCLDAILYEDLIYCKRRRFFTCVKHCDLELESGDLSMGVENWYMWNPLLEDWNMGSPVLLCDTSMDAWDVPRFPYLWKSPSGQGKHTGSWMRENKDVLNQQCIPIPHLVYAEPTDQLYIVVRFLMVVGKGKTLHFGPYSQCKTLGFTVFKVNDRTGRYELVDDLDGLALFVGINNSFAICASHQLKPNSIYFTDATKLKTMNGFYDTGIFDYENKTISPIITPAESDGSPPAPIIWLAPY